jgi:hypothetical protein
MAKAKEKKVAPADTEVDQIVRKVQQEMAVLVKAYGESLEKVHPGEETEAESAPDTSASAPPSDGPPADAGGDGGGSPSAPPADAGGPPAGPPGADAGGPPPGDPAADGGAEGSGPPDPAALKAEFDKMPVPERMAYYQAVKASLAEAMGQDPSAGAGAGGPPPPGAGAPPGPPSPDPAMKAEMEKSERATLTAKAESDFLRKELDKATKALGEMSVKLVKFETDLKTAAKTVEAFVTAPTQKAVTGISQLAKAEPAKNEEVDETSVTTQMLRSIARRPNLTKAERDAVGNYSMNKTGFDKIKHLFAAQKAAA